MTTPEGKIKKQIYDYLQGLEDDDKLVFDRLNSGKVMVKKPGYNHRMTLCKDGTADFYVLIGGRMIFLEVKAPGEKPRKNQIEFEHRVVRHGAWYFVVDSLDDTREIIEGMLCV